MTAGRSRSAGYGRGYRGRKRYISWRIESGWRKTETMCGRMAEKNWRKATSVQQRPGGRVLGSGFESFCIIPWAVFGGANSHTAFCNSVVRPPPPNHSELALPAFPFPDAEVG